VLLLALRPSTWRSLLVLLALLSAHHARANNFYAGKTITISTHSAPGGQYDAYLRLLGRYFGKYIPGSPSIEIYNEPGAGGLLAVNHAANSAPRDGTFLTMVANGLLLFQGIGQPGLSTSLGEFKWIGNFSASNSITVVWKTAGVRNIQDAMRRQVIIGSSGAGSISALLPAAYNALVGAKFKVVLGYSGAAQMNLALRRGEIQGRSGSIWRDFESDFPKETADGTLLPIGQAGQVRDKDLPNIPLLTELVAGDPKKEAVARFVSESLTQNRSVAAPPGVPDDRVQILRAAFDHVMADPQFRADARREGLDLNPTTGAEVQATVADVLATPQDIRDLAHRALAPKLK
jgi:tripartite-type tricarboxylate transporter receptor subunit TctC